MLNKITIFLVLLICDSSFGYSQIKNNADSLKSYISPSVTVTSDRAVERISPVPYSEITQSEIKKIYSVSDVPQFLSELPSIISYSQSGNGVGYSSLTMRGFDQRRISVMVNGIPQNDPEDHNVYWIDFPDITESLSDIQVQRGAGLASYGAAAIGGSINLTTSDFVKNKYIRVYSGIGWQQYGVDSGKFQPTLAKTLFEVSSGLTGNYAFYGRLSRISSDGYRDRSWARMNSYFLSGVRFDDNLTTQVNVFGGPFSDALVYNGLPKSYMSDPVLRRSNFTYFYYDSTGRNINNDYTTVRRKQEVEEFSQPHYEMLNDWKITDNLRLKSSLFYYSGDGYYDYDPGADTTMLRLTEEYGFQNAENPKNAILRGYVGNKHGGIIPRLIWDHPEGTLTVGAEFRIHRSEHWGKIEYAENLPENYDPDYQVYYFEGKRDVLSLYAREMYNLPDNITLDAQFQAVRQSYAIGNEKAGGITTKYTSIDGSVISGSGDIFNINYWFVNPRLGLNWNYSENINVYFLTGITSREPNMANFYSAEFSFYGEKPLFEGKTQPDGSVWYDFGKPLIKPEKMLDFELGTYYKSNIVNFGINFYWMEYYDELVKSGRLDLFGNPIDGNAPRTRHAGIELQASAQILNLNKYGKLLISANTSISHNEILEYDFKTSADEKVSLAGNPVAGFPNIIGNLRISWQSENTFISLLGKYVGEFRSDNFGSMLTSSQPLITYLSGSDVGYYADNLLPSYFIVNFDAAYTFKDVGSFNSIRLQLQINNLLDKLYAAGAEGKEFFPAAERYIFLGIDLQL